MAFTLTLKPEVEQRLRDLAEAQHRSMHKTVEVAIEEYLDGVHYSEEIRRTARRFFDENSEFYTALGDR